MPDANPPPTSKAVPPRGRTVASKDLTATTAASRSRQAATVNVTKPTSTKPDASTIKPTVVGANKSLSTRPVIASKPLVATTKSTSSSKLNTTVTKSASSTKATSSTKPPVNDSVKSSRTASASSIASTKSLSKPTRPAGRTAGTSLEASRGRKLVGVSGAKTKSENASREAGRGEKEKESTKTEKEKEKESITTVKENSTSTPTTGFSSVPGELTSATPPTTTDVQPTTFTPHPTATDVPPPPPSAAATQPAPLTSDAPPSTAADTDIPPTKSSDAPSTAEQVGPGVDKLTEPASATPRTSDPLQIAAQVYPWLYMTSTLEACFEEAEEKAKKDLQTETEQLEAEESTFAGERERFEAEREIEFYDELGDNFSTLAPPLMSTFLSHASASSSLEIEALQLASQSWNPEDGEDEGERMLVVFGETMERLEVLLEEAGELERGIGALVGEFGGGSESEVTVEGEAAELGVESVQERDWDSEQHPTRAARTQLLSIFRSALPVLKARKENLGMALEMMDGARENLSVSLRLESLGGEEGWEEAGSGSGEDEDEDEGDIEGSGGGDGMADGK